MASLRSTVTGKSGEIVITLCPPDSTPKKALKYASAHYVWKTEKPESDTIVVVDTKTNTVFASKQNT